MAGEHTASGILGLTMADLRTQTAPAPGDPPPSLDSSPWKPGDRIGRYQVIAPLAAGGMGMVFAARLVGAHGVERIVALKTLRPITSRSDRTALLTEARVTARLHHRNVVATLDLGEVDDVPYVVMELVDGVSLARFASLLLDKGEELSPELAAWIVMQAANGLHAAHEMKEPNGKSLGLVHRDVSPQNILLSTTGEVKIADFGIAKFEGREESTATGMIKGKFAYMAPEQANAMPLDRRCDVFALGIVLWELLARQRLFHSETPAQTILKVTQLEVRSPSDIRPEVGGDLAAIALRCLAKSPSDRYATAAEVADDLRRVLRARTPVDESDLSRAVERWFGTERREAMTALTTASTDGTTLAMAEESLVVKGPRRRWPGPVLGVSVALLGIGVGGGIAWRLRPMPPPSPMSAEPPPTAPIEAPSATVAAAEPPLPAPPVPSAAPAPSVTVARPPPKRAKPTPAPAKSATVDPTMFGTL
jgi:serine/threonine-protein kinase